MKIIKVKDYEEMSKRGADIVKAQLILNPRSNLGLATGSSPIGLYERLVKSYEAGEIDFKDVHSYNLDEYKGMEKTHDQSYWYFMNHHLFSKVNIDPANTNIPDGMAKDGKAECERYEALIREIGGVDLQLLGLGRNGHIGFNEPDSYFAGMTQCVDLTESTIEANKRFFASKEDVPTQAFSMGIGTIMRAKKILLVVSGKDKAEALKEVVSGEVRPEVPGTILQFHPDVTIIADEEARALL